MKHLNAEEAKKLRQPRGRKPSRLGEIIRDLKPGERVQIDTDIDDDIRPYSAYGIARTVGKRVSLYKTSDTEFIIECRSAEEIE